VKPHPEALLVNVGDLLEVNQLLAVK
jgi:isopenicillin N synthase-like dioxygenase